MITLLLGSGTPAAGAAPPTEKQTHRAAAQQDRQAHAAETRSTGKTQDIEVLRVRWGVALGLTTLIPYGRDKSQPGAPSAEFGPSLAVRFSPLRLDIGRFVELSAFGDISVAGGVKRDRSRDLLEGAAPEVSLGRHGLYRLGAGGRAYPWEHQRGFMPFIGAFGAFVRATRSFTLTDPNTPEVSSPFAGNGGEALIHQGGSLLLTLGGRWDVHVRPFDETSTLPIHLELQWAKNFWHDRDRPASLASVDDQLAPEAMKLDHIGFMLTVGFMP
ncbi:MAG: hypothetical protein ACPGUV_13695 [Polyangiales bacterium]